MRSPFAAMTSYSSEVGSLKSEDTAYRASAAQREGRSGEDLQLQPYTNELVRSQGGLSRSGLTGTVVCTVLREGSIIHASPRARGDIVFDLHAAIPARSCLLHQPGCTLLHAATKYNWFQAIQPSKPSPNLAGARAGSLGWRGRPSSSRRARARARASRVASSFWCGPRLDGATERAHTHGEPRARRIMPHAVFLVFFTVPIPCTSVSLPGQSPAVAATNPRHSNGAPCAGYLQVTYQDFKSEEDR
jgi:hypothetical protein